MDNSFEQCVRKSDYTQDEKKYKMYNIFMIISAICAFIGLVFLLLGQYFFGGAMLVLWVAVAFYFYKLKDGAIIEYDYEFIDGVISISRIYHQSKRKCVVSISLEKASEITPIDINNLNKLYDSGAKVINCALNDDARLYSLRGSYKGQNVIVIWEPKLSLLKLIRSERVNLVVL